MSRDASLHRRGSTTRAPRRPFPIYHSQLSIIYHLVLLSSRLYITCEKNQHSPALSATATTTPPTFSLSLSPASLALAAFVAVFIRVIARLANTHFCSQCKRGVHYWRASGESAAKCAVLWGAAAKQPFYPNLVSFFRAVRKKEEPKLGGSGGGAHRSSCFLSRAAKEREESTQRSEARVVKARRKKKSGEALLTTRNEGACIQVAREDFA